MVKREEIYVIPKPKNEKGWNPNFEELQQALDDENHPHHAEAIIKNKELAKALSPAIKNFEILTKTANKIKDTVRQNLNFVKPLIELDKSFGSVKKHYENSPKSIKKLNQKDYFSELFADNNAIFTSNYFEIINDKNKINNERYELELKVFQSIEANLKDMNRSLRESAKLAKIDSKRQFGMTMINLIIASATLVFSILMYLR